MCHVVRKQNRWMNNGGNATDLLETSFHLLVNISLGSKRQRVGGRTLLCSLINCKRVYTQANIGKNICHTHTPIGLHEPQNSLTALTLPGTTH